MVKFYNYLSKTGEALTICGSFFNVKITILNSIENWPGGIHSTVDQINLNGSYGKE